MTTAQEISGMADMADMPHDARGKPRARLRELLRWQTWTVARTLIVLLILPLSCAVGASALLVSSSLGAKSTAQSDARLALVEQGVANTVAALAQERALVATAAEGTSPDPDQISTARADVQSAMNQMTGLLATVTGVGAPKNAANGQLAGLTALRATTASSQVVIGYSAITGALLDLDAALVAQIKDAALAHQLLAAYDLAQSADATEEQQSLIDIGLTKGGLDGGDLNQARVAGALAQNWLDQFSAVANGTQLGAYVTGVPAPAWSALRALQDTVLDNNGNFHSNTPVQQWRAASQPVVSDLTQTVAQLNASAFATASANANDAVDGLRALAIALAAATVLSAWLVTVLLRNRRASLRAFGSTAMDVAEARLPELLSKIRDGRAEDDELPRLPLPPGQEYRSVAHAFQLVTAQAAVAANEQAKMRSGYYAVFVNMFRRSQSLLQRQLRLIERLEHDERAADRLEMLYQLDHLVTRMRRNNENVLILSGTELVRRAAKPIPLASVIQAASSEIEHFQRVEVLDPPAAQIVDSAASDLIRMLAELLDNATSFSPPETKVTVQAQVLRDGSVSIAVADHGIGMPDEQIQEANDRLVRLGSAELAKSRRVGLLVVGRLAGRQGFGVELLGGERSVGITALVSVPAELVLGAERPGWADRRHALSASAARQRSAPTQRLESVRRPDPAASELRVFGEREQRAGAVAQAVRPARVQLSRQLVERAHENIPAELPTRKPNRLIGRVPSQSLADRVTSAWFHARETARNPRRVSPAAGAQEARNWLSVADEGWSIVETVSRSGGTYTYTEDGLPQREAGAHLLPGSAQSNGDSANQGRKKIERNPDHTRSRLSSFQQGVRKAKDADGEKTERRSGGWRSMGKR